MRIGLEQLRHRYCTRGYVDFTPVPDTQIDDAAGLISVSIYVDEGPVFHVGKLIVDGEESVPGARQRMLKAWQTYEGTIYDCEVLKRFLRDIHAPSSVTPGKVFVTQAEHQTHVVNVRITLAKSPEL